MTLYKPPGQYTCYSVSLVGATPVESYKGNLLIADTIMSTIFQSYLVED